MNRKMLFGPVATVIHKRQRAFWAALLLTGTVPAQGQEAGAPPDEVAAAYAAQQEETIAALKTRVEQLEQIVNILANEYVQQRNNGAGQAPATAPGAIAPSPSSPAPGAAVPPPRAGTVPETAGRDRSSGPGTVEVDLEAAERALERTLTQLGALLLPPGKAEIEPFIRYTRSEERFPLISLDRQQQLFAANGEVERDEFTLGLDYRMGLPGEWQLEVSLPVRAVDQATLLPAGINTLRRQENDEVAFGDLGIGIAKTLLREKGWRPDLIARVFWDTNTGQREHNGVPFPDGNNELTVSLVALKRQDPLAFTASVFYQKGFEEDDYAPGDSYGYSLGAVLAASPETSLRLGFQQSFSDEAEIDGRNIVGSDQNGAALVLGASTIVGKGKTLLVNAGIGLTDDASDYFINVSLPIRFDLF